MHEFSLATELVRHLIDVAKANEAVKVEEVVVECGAMLQVVDEAMFAAFQALVVGTVAQGAKLVLKHTPMVAECQKCNKRFSADIECFLCPHCGQADTRVVEGRAIVLASVVCLTKDECGGEN